MSKPGFCEKHGHATFTATSQRFKELIEQDGSITKDDICKLIIHHPTSSNIHYIDIEIFDHLGIATHDQSLVLTGHDRESKKLNDKLVINKIFAEMKPHWVCATCLEELLRTAQRTSSTEPTLPRMRTTEFTLEFANAVRKAYPVSDVIVKGPLTLVVTNIHTEKISVDIDKSFKQYFDDPANLEKIIGNALSALSEKKENSNDWYYSI